MASKTNETLPSGATSYAIRWRERNGRQHTKRFVNWHDADSFKAKIERELREGRSTDPNRGREKFADAARRYVETAPIRETTSSVYRRQVEKHIIPWLGNLRPNDIDVSDIIAMRDGLLAAGVGTATVVRAMKLVVRVLNVAMAEGKLDKNVASMVPKPRHEERDPVFMDMAQVERLANEASRHGDKYATLVRFACEVGARFGEIAALRVSDLNLSSDPARVTIQRSVSEVEGRLVLGKGKTKASRRTVPMTPRLRDELRDLTKEKEPSDAVFTAKRGGPLRLNDFRERIFNPSARAAGIYGDDGELVHIHDCRHTAISLWGRAGYSLTTAQAWAGHSNIGQTSRYSHWYPDAADMSALSNLFTPKPDLRVVND